MHVRRADAGDLDAAAKLWQERAALIQQSDALPQTLLSPETWRDAAMRWLDASDTACFVACDGCALRGFIIVSLADTTPGNREARRGRMVDMALDLHQAHPGLASSLLNAARDWLTARGANMLTVDAPAQYPVEIAFWQAQGARPRFTQYWLPL